MYPNQYVGAQGHNPYLRNLQNLKAFFHRPLVLAAAIICTIHFLLTFAANVSGMGNVVIHEAVSQFGSQYASASRGSYTVASIIAGIVPALMCVAIWLIYAKSQNPNPMSSPRAGLTILFVLCVVGIVGISLFGLIILLGLSMSDAIASSFYAAPGGRAFELLVFSFVVVLVVLLALLAISIVQLRFVNSMRKSMESVQMKTGGATALGVIYIILACFSILGLLGSLGAGHLGMGAALMDMLTTLTGAAQMIVIGAVAISYGNYARAKNQEYAVAQQPLPSYAAPYPQQPSAYPQAGVPGPAQPQAPIYQRPSAWQSPQPFVPAYQQPPVQQGEQAPEFGVDPHEREGQGNPPQEQEVCPVCGCKKPKADPVCPQCGTQVHGPAGHGPE